MGKPPSNIPNEPGKGLFRSATDQFTTGVRSATDQFITGDPGGVHGNPIKEQDSMFGKKSEVTAKTKIEKFRAIAENKWETLSRPIKEERTKNAMRAVQENPNITAQDLVTDYGIPLELATAIIEKIKNIPSPRTLFTNR
jgi:hypothetical protein